MRKLEDYHGLVLETHKSPWFQEMLKESGLKYEPGANGWGITAVKAFLGGYKLTERIDPVVGCACLMREAGVEWMGVVAEIQGDFLRAVEFGTRYGYAGTQSGFEVQWKRRAIASYAGFFEPVKEEVKEEVKVKAVDEIAPPKLKKVDTSFEVSTDAPPSQNSLADELQPTINEDI